MEKRQGRISDTQNRNEVRCQPMAKCLRHVMIHNRMQAERSLRTEQYVHEKEPRRRRHYLTPYGRSSSLIINH